MPAFSELVTPVVLTRDEAPNIGRTLGQLTWAREVIVVDSFSTDATAEIVATFPNARLVQRRFDDLATQWTFAVSLATTPWVLTLDADYYLPDRTLLEIARLEPPPMVHAYEVEFTYAIRGRPLRRSLYPPRAVLLRRGHFEFYMDGHTQRVRISGITGRLEGRIVHDDRKPLGAFIARQRRYMRDEAAKLRATPMRDLPLSGRVRKLVVVAPFAVLLHTLFVQRLVFSGPAGWYYAFERALAEGILSLELLGLGSRNRS
ncbi:MAG TPA: glycosyltransferase family 2 protein [Thermoanaerobaculia bacterium]|nr:glycosyltransferase family 2 protein [Thermoanaerobaculia bacterium]